MVRPDNSAKRDQARISAATGQADIDAQQRALAEGGQEALYREQVAQQLAANRVQLEREYEAKRISQSQYEQQLKQQQDTVDRNSQFYGESLRVSVDAGVSRHRASDRASGQIGESHRFYREIGYSQYAGRYAPFEIPEGHEVRGITEGPEGLNITFVDPVAEKQAKEQYAASEMFYKSIGFEQYGGKYSPFDIPEGHKVRGITEGPTGLNIEFYSPEQEAAKKKSVDFFTSLGYSQYGGKYQPFDVPEGFLVKNIVESPTGLNVEFYDPVAEQQAKNQFMVSDMFYKSIGYAQYGGKYEPFKIPEGHKVDAISETEKGLTITFSPVPITERNYEKAIQDYAESFLPEPYVKSNIEKVLAGEENIDLLSDAEKQELYIITSSQAMAPIMAFRNFAIQQKQDSKAEFTDTLKEGKTAAAATSAGGILKSIELAEKSVAKAAKIDEAPKASASDVVSNFLADPLGGIGGFASFTEQVAKLEGGLLGQVVAYKAGEAIGFVNMVNETKNMISGVMEGKKLADTANLVPKPGVLESTYKTPSYKSLEAKTESGKLGVTSARVQAALAPAIVAPVVGPSVLPISGKAIVASGLLNYGITEGVQYASSGEFLPLEQKIGSFALGEGLALGFSGASLAAVKAVSRASPALAQSRVALGLAKSAAVAPVGGAAGYITSGGDKDAALIGAGLAAGASLGLEFAPQIAGAIKTNLPKSLGGSTKLTPAVSTVGKAGTPIKTYVSKPVKELDGKSLRIVADVTEKPVGTKGVTTKSLIQEYTGKTVPTGHATLNVKSFNLKKGGETLLKGFPDESAGYRQSEQLYHFYSAPGSDDYVTVYGGYMGVGKGYSGTPKIVFGGESTALVTTKTPIAAQFLKKSGETTKQWLTRTSQLSGKTGIAQETLAGKSAERQFITPAAYERFGVKLPGSKFVSEGSVGKFTVQELPTGKLAKIPVVRTLTSKFTTFKVVKGKYAPTSGEVGGKVLDVQKYGAGYTQTVKTSVSKTSISPSLVSVSPVSVSKQLSKTKTVSKTKSTPQSPASAPASPSISPISSPSQSGFSEPLSSPEKSPASSMFGSTSRLSSGISKSKSTSKFSLFSKSASAKKISSPSVSSGKISSLPFSQPTRTMPFPPTSSVPKKPSPPTVSPYSYPASLFSSTSGFASPPSGTSKPLTSPSPLNVPYNQFLLRKKKRSNKAFGLWRKQDNPVKTSAAMLKTFGVLQGNPKRSAKVKRRKR